MRQRYIWDEKKNKLVKAEEYERPVGPTLILDLDQKGQSYFSPVDNEYITSRRARRENLARHGCREVDPSERLSK